jgi:hypothetical protein
VPQQLHEKYVPILRFAQGERFFPMPVEDFLAYSTLRLKRDRTPILGQGQVTLSLLSSARERPIDVYLQSVPATLADQNVVARWSSDMFKELAGASYTATHWQAALARAAYNWLSPKTESAARLFWWNDLVMPLMAQGKRSKADLPRLDLPPEIRQAAVENYERSQPQTPRYAYYYRTTQDADYLCLQYWFFYAFNDWATGYDGMNDHEGDWEGMYLFFKLDESGVAQEPPAYITYVGHHSRLTKPWGHPVMSLDGTHPEAYVAAGSHATYPERKRYELMQLYGLVDYATGDGVTIEPSGWRLRVDLNAQPWASAFLGTWGTRYWLPRSWAEQALGTVQKKIEEFGLPGISGPRGPRYTEEGTERPNWSRVASWAGILNLQKNQ